MSDAATQLEWFDLPRQTPPVRTPLIPVEPLRVRADHVVLAVMMLLIGGSVVFAVGVERGKQLARVERWQQNSSMTTTAQQPAEATTGKTKSSTSSDSSGGTTGPSGTPAQKTLPPQSPRKPGKALAAHSRFAVQVVSYRQPKFALRELQRLQQRGEEAFLLNQEGRTMLLVGPFPSRERASNKLANLKRLYQDCFVRTL